MSNGHVCCLLGVCCPPDEDGRRAAALFEEMKEAHHSENGLMEPAGHDGLHWAASWIIANFDLVPKGVGRAIVEGYAPEFEKKHGKKS